ncbi:MAG TPA: DUF4861 family protein, partial [Ohtaekwangia sp.]|uniref:DUF4861 family protein n=1 Tax=Ohtaekwangia sp. TaxID=2066019 RepID=UPI002F9559F4
MKYIIFCVAVLIAAGIQAQSLEKEFPESFRVKVTNPLNIAREHVVIVLSPEEISKHARRFNSNAFIVIDNGKEIPSQYNKQDQDNAGVVFVLDKLNASASLEVIVRFHPTATLARSYPKRTQAELSHKVGGEWKNREYIGGNFRNVDFLQVPPEHKDHSWFIRYEGPGWESDKVGYRFYLDQRNATDVFGKKTQEVTLQLAGQDGFDSYHNMQPWGMDVMKVGKSLGIGSIGAFVNGVAIRVEKTDGVTCRITENGTIYSSILTQYTGWAVADKKQDVQSRLSIHQGTRLTHEMLTITNDPDNICTGIVKDKLAKLYTSEGDAQHWAYLATYGKQSLNNDGLG